VRGKNTCEHYGEGKLKNGSGKNGR
jgi:hypothetical protein